MNVTSFGKPTHTPITPGRRRNHRPSFLLALTLGLLGWALIGLVVWGAKVLLG